MRRFREPPARQRLRNTTVVCAISSGYGQRSEAAPLQGSGRIGLASEAALHGPHPTSTRNSPLELLELLELLNSSSVSSAACQGLR